MRTAITYHEVYVDPGEAVELEHVDGAVVSVVSGEHVGGGSDKRWVIGVVVTAPVQEQERTAETAEPEEPARGRRRK